MVFLWKTIRQALLHKKYSKIINKAIDDDQIVAKISTLLGVQFKRDWVGRIYAIINPNIKDGKYNPEQVYEFNFNGDPDNTQYIEEWAFSRMQLVKNFIHTENLFELFEYDITHVGDYNYLVVLTPLTWKPLMKRFKNMIWELLVEAAIIIPVFFYVLP